MPELCYIYNSRELNTLFRIDFDEKIKEENDYQINNGELMSLESCMEDLDNPDKYWDMFDIHKELALEHKDIPIYVRFSW